MLLQALDDEVNRMHLTQNNAPLEPKKHPFIPLRRVSWHQAKKESLSALGPGLKKARLKAQASWQAVEGTGVAR